MNGNGAAPVSIIVPVYNVYEWIDECMQSIADQTFGDFEIILINDGSTDGSDQKCIQWKNRDSRIRYIDKENEGLYMTWNRGIREAKGEYIAFVDSDDWIDLQYVEKLYHAAVNTGADMVECDFWRYNNITGEKTYRPCYGRMEKDYSLKEHMIYGESTIWKYMSKKSVWAENKITIPNCMGASHAVYVLLLASGAKIVNIHEPLYYYRRFRKGSILDINGKNSVEQGKMGIQELNALTGELKKRDLYDQYNEVIEKTVKYRLSDLLAAQFARKTEKEFEAQFNNYYEYISENFPGGWNDRYFTAGGYNLNRIVSYLPELHNPFYRFNFSSIISMMHPVKNVKEYRHSNRYRKIMIDRDIHSLFWDILDRARPKYLFLDFLEERFDMIQMKDGGFITKSDALDGADIALPDGIIIKRDSTECWEQWKDDCAEFFQKVLKYISAENIILIENYLSEEKGDIYVKTKYENIEMIKKTNRMLKNYYDYFKQNCEGIRYIEAYKCSYYFTDEKYEYGAVPPHLNEVVNKEIACKAVKLLGEVADCESDIETEI